MLFGLGLLLASQFWLMSDRASFWDADKVSDHTEFMMDSNGDMVPFDRKQIIGKNILLLVHGYNSDQNSALSTYHLINMHLSALNNQSKFYDYIIGYLWPGNDCFLEYFEAKRHAASVANIMRAHLEVLFAQAAAVDILAHSMGNLLVLEALNYSSKLQKKVVRNFYSLGAAVDEESIETNEKFYQSTQNCEKFFVFFSKRDDVLKWLYHLAEGDEALGYEGIEDITKLPPNVQLLDYTEFVGGHNQYFTYLPIYDFIKNQFSYPMLLKKLGASPSLTESLLAK